MSKNVRMIFIGYSKGLGQQSHAYYGSASNLIALSNKDVVEFQNTHNEEKREMNDLNARLAEYIEQVIISLFLIISRDH